MRRSPRRRLTSGLVGLAALGWVGRALYVGQVRGPNPRLSDAVYTTEHAGFWIQVGVLGAAGLLALVHALRDPAEDLSDPS